jgi:hypothetical protein
MREGGGDRTRVDVHDTVGRAAGFRDLCRPATLVLLVLPLSVFGAGISTNGRLATAAMIAVLAAISTVSVLVGIMPIRHSYLWIALLAALLLVSFAFPLVPTQVPPYERHRVVDLVGPLRAMPLAQLDRLFDLAGLFAGLALLGVSIALSPHPRQVGRVIALSGMVAAGYVLVCGGFDNNRLEGLGCNPNYLGFLLALSAVTAVGLVRSAHNPRWLVPAAICFIALFNTHSRSAFLAAAVGVVLVFVQGRSWHLRLLLMAPAATAAAAAAANGMLRPMARHLANFGASGRTTDDLRLSNGMRKRAGELAVRAIMEHPLRGIGLSTFPDYAKRSPALGVYLATHDEYLRLAAEAGVATLLVFLVVLWLGAGRRQVGDLALLRAVVLTYVVILFFANPLANLVVSAPFWVSLGCLLASRRCRQIRTTAFAAKTIRAVWRQRQIVLNLRSRPSREGVEQRAGEASQCSRRLTGFRSARTGAHSSNSSMT